MEDTRITGQLGGTEHSHCKTSLAILSQEHPGSVNTQVVFSIGNQGVGCGYAAAMDSGG